MIFSSSVHPDESKEIEQAICFLVDEYRKSGQNPKPVVFHSLRVAYMLIELGYRGVPIIVAILHDLLEDTKVASHELQKKFGSKISDCVASLTYNETITDPVARYRDLFTRTVNYGKDACLVKAADLFDNMRYFGLVENREKVAELVGKVKYFIDYAKVIQEEPILRMLREHLEKTSDTLRHS